MKPEALDALRTYYDGLAHEPTPRRDEADSAASWMAPVAAAAAAYLFLVLAARAPVQPVTGPLTPPQWQMALLADSPPANPLDRRQSYYWNPRRGTRWV